MKDTAGFKSYTGFIGDKIQRLGNKEKNFQVLFDFMFEQESNVMAETSRGFRIKKVTYGECKKQTISLAKIIKAKLIDTPCGATVGLYMANSLDWIKCFWAILMCGFNPLLMNAKLPPEQLERVIKDAKVKAIISDGKVFGVNTLIYSELIQSTEQRELDCWGKEVIFTSSGTTGNAKLLFYGAENFYHQISNSIDIMASCPALKRDYKGHLKLLALLPFYHIFGFVAVYIWFGFFARTFVFMKDLTPHTLLSTVKKHNVTHIYAVPMVWETVYKQAIKTIKARGDKTYAKFLKALSTVNKTELLGDIVSKVAFKEIRQNLFGDSIRLLISGGSAISKQAIEFLNAVGYVTVNGYGMTELAITSVERSSKRKERNLCSIGQPFGCVEYKISPNGELLVKSKARASKMICGDKVVVTDYDEWFNTQDMAFYKDGRYYLTGRKDDLIISSSGENINPQVVEDGINVAGIVNKCLIKGQNGAILLVEVDKWVTFENIKNIEEKVIDCLRKMSVSSEIERIIITKDKLLSENEFKLSRHNVSVRLAKGLIRGVEDAQNSTSNDQATDLEKEIIEIFKEVLGEHVEPTAKDDFFTRLNGSSLDYFQMISLVKLRYDLEIEVFEGKGYTTVEQIAKAVEQEKNKAK